MNFLKKSAIVLAVLGFGINSVSAQTASWNNVSVPVGTASTSVELTFDTQGATVTGYGINTNYDNVNMVWSSCTSAATVCNDNAGGNSGTVNIGAIAGPGANPLVTLTFDTSATPAGVYNITSPNATWVDAAFVDQPLPVTMGTITVLAVSPQYTSVPAPGTAIAMGSILQGGTNPTSSIDITNTGDVGTTLTGTCSAPAPFIVTGGAYSVAEGAAAVTVGVACDAAAAPAAYAEDLTCTHNGSNIMGDVTYPMTCEVLAAAAIGNQNPVNGTALSVVVAPGGSGTTSVTFSEEGMQGVAITDLSCTVTPGVGFAITAPGAFPATVPAAGTLPVEVTFTDPGDGSATAGSLDCTYTDGTGAVAVSYPLNFIIRAVNVPALSMMGYLVLALGFGLIGFFAFRRRA